MTFGYVTNDIDQAYQNDTPVSKEQLYECDFYALKRTFYNINSKISHLIEKEVASFESISN
jgi:hypothetical protein